MRDLIASRNKMKQHAISLVEAYFEQLEESEYRCAERIASLIASNAEDLKTYAEHRIGEK